MLWIVTSILKWHPFALMIIIFGLYLFKIDQFISIHCSFLLLHMTDKSYTKTISLKYWLQNAVTIKNNESCHNQPNKHLVNMSQKNSFNSASTFNCYYLKKEKPSFEDVRRRCCSFISICPEATLLIVA